MEDLREQLAELRRRVAGIDRKWGSGAAETSPPRKLPQPSRVFIEQLMTGEVVHTPHGEHFETERLWERHRRHGSVDISALAELPDDLLEQLSAGAIAQSPPAKWAFLDTETTGLAGGAGTYAFLVGVGSIEPSGFRLRQFFMRDYGEEASQLFRLAEYLARFDVLITYNGKSYDQPLLETRFRMARARTPFDRLEHLDLLFGARRLWKLRLESCRREESLRLFRRAVDMGLPDDLLFRTLWDIAAMEKRLGREEAALAAFAELAESRNPYRVRALEELAKHYEHRERNYAMALEMTRNALVLEDTSALRRREERLRARMERPGPGGVQQNIRGMLRTKARKSARESPTA